MIWQRWTKSRLVVSALPGSRVSHAISPALPWERLRVYLAGSVCPMRWASGSRGSTGMADAASRNSSFFNAGNHIAFRSGADLTCRCGPHRIRPRRCVPMISRRSLFRMGVAAAGVGALRLPAAAQGTRRRMLALIGDRYHNADYIRVDLDRTLDGLNLAVDYTIDYDRLSRQVLASYQLFLCLPDGMN